MLPFIVLIPKSYSNNKERVLLADAKTSLPGYLKSL
jgi:hypothetical protein